MMSFISFWMIILLFPSTLVAGTGLQIQQKQPQQRTSKVPTIFDKAQPMYLRKRSLQSGNNVVVVDPRTIFSKKNANSKDSNNNERITALEQSSSATVVASQQQTQKVQVDNDDKLLLSTRQFVSYSSSDWELEWIDNADIWSNERQICNVLLKNQSHYLHDFLNFTCSKMRMPSPYDSWCIIYDNRAPLWYNSAHRGDGEFFLSWVRPKGIPSDIPLPKPNNNQAGPQHSHFLSKFIFYDQIKRQHYVEYIEPLVSHLRFPLSRCLTAFPGTPEYKFHDVIFGGWILPPPSIRSNRALFFDVGASSWEQVDESSLAFVFQQWQRHGVELDITHAFRPTTTSLPFYRAMPREFRATTHFKQCEIAATEQEDSNEHPFLPTYMKRNSKHDDYVLFKLDIDAPDVERGNIDFILSDTGNAVDELIWEHHIKGNYLMEPLWKEHVSDQTLGESYQLFLKLRQKGIRAHSWV